MTHHNQPAGPGSRTIPELFAEQVRERPTATAVSAGERQLSFAELDALGDRVATALLAHGVGARDVVAVRMARGHLLVGALLGIVKAGAAYLSFETATPPARCRRLAATASAVLLVTDDERETDLGPPVLRLPSGLVDAPAPVSPPRPPLGPEDLAYVSFTSGSTGQPKGVAVPHRGVARLVAGDFVEFGPEHTFLHLAPTSFDASTFEIWGALLTGGRLAVHPPGPPDVDALAAVLSDEKVTTLWLTAGLFHRMVDHRPEALGGLRQLLAGGDVLDPARVRDLVARFPEIRLVNGYGPTENTTFTACHTVVAPVPTGSVPIGRPVPGTEVRVLDADLRRVAPGEPGELYVTGTGLSRGYVAAPATTATHFVPDPYASVPGQRMYRTGDLVREAPTGELEFLGRADRQVKIRGVRVEPSEVERELTALPGVRDAAVVVREGRGVGDASLVAFLVPDTPDGPDDPDGSGGWDGGTAADPRTLTARARNGLRAALPAAMIPSALITLPALPLTPNGKVDRAALPMPQRTPRQADERYVAPRALTEQLVCDLWAECLGVEQVGVLDDFFELGGNSLASVDLVAHTEVLFDVEVPFPTIFLHPTAGEFAHAIDALLTADEERTP